MADAVNDRYPNRRTSTMGSLVVRRACATNAVSRARPIAIGTATLVAAKLVTLYGQGRLRLPIHAAFPLTQADRAHHQVQTGHVRGKVVLTTD